MIRKLVESDRANVLEYLSFEPSFNLFIIGDIEGIGFDQDYQDVWADFNLDGNIIAVMLRFHENFIPYSHDEQYDWSNFKDLIRTYDRNSETYIALSGKSTIIKKFDDILTTHKRRETYFCELTTERLLEKTGLEKVKLAESKDAKRVWEIIETIDEFVSVNSEERIRETIENKTGRIYYIEMDGQMVCVTQTAAENSQSAMVVGVATLKDYRRRGLMSLCLSKLCTDLLSERKNLCLFYSNPEAGSVYHRLGFKTIGTWTMVNFVI